jgi:uncharacterized protein (DUF983 family)
MREKSFLTALAQSKCPRCRQGDIFPYPATNLRRFNVMNPACPSCGVRLEPEPGFYQGAMFVSYAITIVFLVIIWLGLYYLAANPPEWVYMVVFVGVIILIAPLNYRYSRVLFLYFFGGIKYDPRLSK